ncbi:MAG: prepilin peptidase [Lachnospiraceae bacterium]
MIPNYFLYLVFVLYGLVIGSFLNVCICRIPNHENIVTVRSHCMQCGYQLKWYDLVPLFSFLVLKGRCRQCRQKISIQYPIVEAMNGILYLIIVMRYGGTVETVLYCLLASALLTLSVIDIRTYEIPFGINIFIGCLGLCHMALQYPHFSTYIIGFFAVSVFLQIIIWITKGRGIGGGDMKLMAVCGLVLGWRLIILAFLLGCVIGSVIHVIRMTVSKADHVLAMGPYLSIGVMIALLWGEPLIQWYVSLFL